MLSNRRALALLSGGLDSTIAIKMMLEQGIDVIAVNFMSPFCTCSGGKSRGCHLASQVAKSLQVPIRIVHKGMEYLRIVEKPRFGRGKGINPCIDCRIFAFSKVAEMMETENASFVVTGEVLGQRPMSQKMGAIELIERESGLQGRIVRPLSAHFFPPTIPEKDGILDRVKLLSIQGRSRKKQMDFAKERGLDVFGCPAGGCLLTDPVIAARMKDLFLNKTNYDLQDAKLATVGKHFRLNNILKVILGRDHNENEKLRLMAGRYPTMEFVDMPGPLAVACGTPSAGDIELIAKLMRYHTKHSSNGPSQMLLKDGKHISMLMSSGGISESDVSNKRII